MRRILLTTLTVLVAGLAGGCATHEYVEAWKTCSRDWAGRIAPDYRQVLVTKERRTEVPDGTETCTTVGSTKRCEKGMRTEWVPYTAVETVDANAQLREQRTRECTQARCAQIYGNPDCKV